MSNHHEKTLCPLCGTPAELSDDTRHILVDCPVCGSIALSKGGDTERQIRQLPEHLRRWVPTYVWRDRRSYGHGDSRFAFSVASAVVDLSNNAKVRQDVDRFGRPLQTLVPIGECRKLEVAVLQLLAWERWHAYQPFEVTRHSWARLGCPGEQAMRGVLAWLAGRGFISMVQLADSPDVCCVQLTSLGEAELPNPDPT